MGWKDSGDAVVYPDGSLVKGPKALCELQGYVYSTWMRMAEIYDALDDRGRAGKLRGKAAALFERFNAVFWDDDMDFYVYALDGAKTKSVPSLQMPAIAGGAESAPAERAKKVVKRLMAPDMWTGGASAPSPQPIRRSIRTIIRLDRSGRTTMRLSPRVSSFMASERRRRRSLTTSARPQANSCSISCRNSTPPFPG